MNSITTQPVHTEVQQADQVCQRAESTVHPHQPDEGISLPEWFMVKVTGPGETMPEESFNLDELRRWARIAPFIRVAEMEQRIFTGCTLVLDQGAAEGEEEPEPTIMHVYIDE